MTSLCPELERIYEICGFDQDPNVALFIELFSDIDFEDFSKLNASKEKIVNRLLAVNLDAKRIKTEKDLEKVVVQEEGSMRFRVKEPILIDSKTGFNFYMNSFGAQKIFMGEDCCFENSSIHSPTYMQPRAHIEFSSLQAERRPQFLGFGAKLSNVRECRGLFVSGYVTIPVGKINTYLHANSVNNFIGGAGSDLCVGVNIMNHPEEGEKQRVVNPLDCKVYEIKDKKAPVIFGMNASVGAGTLIDYGTVVGANEKVSGLQRLHGLVYQGKIFAVPRRLTHEVSYP